MGKFETPDRAEEAMPLKAGQRIYAIGDVHGCDEQLGSLLDDIDSDLADYQGKAILVFLGDYVDRGPDSARVVERLVAGDLPGDEQYFLMGNHEQAMLEAIEGAAAGWLAYGGIQTLESYGVDKKALFHAPSIGELIEQHVPKAHLDFLRSLAMRKRIDDYLFVHAGIRPGVPLDEQEDRDLMWIRDDFLKSRSDHGVVIVHGHTISDKPERKANRIGVDTGCYATGTLTAVRLEGASVDFLSS